MSEPLLSVIMPMRNVDPRPMLDSLLGQQIPMQFICVDDQSTDDTVAKVEAWSAASGQAVEILHNEKRLYSYGARLHGFEKATAPIVWNADADDRIPANCELGKAFLTMQSHMPDILHCRAIGLQGADPLYKNLPWADPVAPKLAGDAIFETFMQLDYPPAILWNKFFSLELCKKIIEFAPAIEVRYFDVKFLGLLSILLAGSYIGANELIYEYKMRTIRPAWLYARQVDALLLLQKSLPPIVEKLAPNGLPPFLDYCQRRLVIQTGHLCIMAEAELASKNPEDANSWLKHEILANLSRTDLLKALKISIAANENRIQKMLTLLGGTCQSASKSADLAKNDDLIALLKINANLARKITAIMAPNIDITKKAN